MVFGIIPECRSDSFRNKRSVSPESPLEEVARAVRAALRFPAIAFDAVKHLLLCAIERRPPKLDLENYPHLPMAEVALTRAADYQVLLREAR